MDSLVSGAKHRRPVEHERDQPTIDSRSQDHASRKVRACQFVHACSTWCFARQERSARRQNKAGWNPPKVGIGTSRRICLCTGKILRLCHAPLRMTTLLQSCISGTAILILAFRPDRFLRYLPIRAKFLYPAGPLAGKFDIKPVRSGHTENCCLWQADLDKYRSRVYNMQKIEYI
jgi:hypothetical protein